MIGRHRPRVDQGPSLSLVFAGGVIGMLVLGIVLALLILAIPG